MEIKAIVWISEYGSNYSEEVVLSKDEIEEAIEKKLKDTVCGDDAKIDIEELTMTNSF